MRVFTTYFIFCYLLLSISCSNENKEKLPPSINDFSWLVGDWQINGAKHFERWQLINDSILSAINYEIKGAEVIQNESIQLRKERNQWQFIPTVRKENESVSTVFVKTNEAVDSLIFENPGHDFPKKIVYVKKGERKILAFVEGDGQRIDFEMRKISNN